jgi:hypothetical protein
MYELPDYFLAYAAGAARCLLYSRFGSCHAIPPPFGTSAVAL